MASLFAKKQKSGNLGGCATDIVWSSDGKNLLRERCVNQSVLDFSNVTTLHHEDNVDFNWGNFNT